MTAIFRHELESYFSGLTGYVFTAFLLFFAGIYTMVYNLSSALAAFEYVLGGMSFVFLVLVPILTMRVLAEERHRKTDQLLYSLPLTMTEVVLGKYFAMLAVFAVPMLILCLYPLVLSAYGNVYLPAAYSAICGFFFLGAALLAVGTYVSSVTESQTMAAGLCFLVMLLNYFLGDLAAFVPATAAASYYAFAVLIVGLGYVVYRMTRSGLAAGVLTVAGEALLVGAYVLWGDRFAGLFSAVMTELSLFERLYVFLDGVFDVTGLVYMVTVAAVFLFMSVQSMEKGRWSE